MPTHRTYVRFGATIIQGAGRLKGTTKKNFNNENENAGEAATKLTGTEREVQVWTELNYDPTKTETQGKHI